MSLTLSQVAGLQTSKYFNIAGLAILVFDYAITFEDEVRWVWGRRWDVTRCVFTASRYFPFVGAAMTAYAALRTNSDHCGPSLEENIFHILGIVAAELLLVLRTYAFWQGNKRVLYGLLGYAVVTICAAIAINVVPKQLFPGAQAPPGCLLFAGRDATLVYLLLLLFEIVIFSLTAYKRFSSYREVMESMVRTVYRDSMFYIACIILVSFSNVIIDGAFAFQYSDLLDIPQITIHSVLASRVLFNLRKHSYVTEKGDMTTTDVILTSIEYRAPAVPCGSGSVSSGSRGVTSVFIDVDVDVNVDVDADVDMDHRRSNISQV